MIFEDLIEFSHRISADCLLIGIDFGIKKIGLAVSSPSRSMAMPHSILKNDAEIFNRIIKIATDQKACGFIVGMPVNMNGEIGDSANRAKNFAIKLLSLSNLPIFLQDERRTSKAADSLLAIAGYNRKQRNEADDAVAASLILESAISRLKSLET